jgi:hypothetical protein
LKNTDKNKFVSLDHRVYWACLVASTAGGGSGAIESRKTRLCVLFCLPLPVSLRVLFALFLRRTGKVHACAIETYSEGGGKKARTKREEVRPCSVERHAESESRENSPSSTVCPSLQATGGLADLVSCGGTCGCLLPNKDLTGREQIALGRRETPSNER